MAARFWVGAVLPTFIADDPTPVYGTRTSTILTRPAGSGPNDLKVGWIWIDGNVTPTLHSDFIQLTGSPWTLPSDNNWHWYFFYTFADAASWTSTHSSANTIGYIAAYADVDMTTPIDAQPATPTEYINVTTATATGITTATANAMLILLGTMNNPHATASGSGMTEREDGAGVASYAYDLVQASPGASGNKTVTFTIDSSTVFMFAIRPATSGRWSDTSHWSLTSGGAGGQAVPSAADDVTFDSAGNVGCVLNTGTAKVAKTLTVTSGYTQTLTFNIQLSVSGSINMAANFSYAGATTNKLRMIAAGTWTTNGKDIAQDIEIGGTTTFTCTLADALTCTGNLTLTNTTSTIFAGAFDLIINNCTISGTQTVTIVNNIAVLGTLTISDATVLNGATFIWYIYGTGLVMTGAISSGTSGISIEKGTWSGTANVGIDLSFVNGVADEVIVSGTVSFGASGKILTSIGSSVVTTGSTLNIPASCIIKTFNTQVTWNNITITAAITLSIEDSELTVSGTLTLPNAAVTFATATSVGFKIGTLTNATITATRVYTFQAGTVYTVTTNFVTVHAAAQTVRFTFTSSSGTDPAFFNLGNATHDVGFLDPTRIDASGGNPIYTHHGVITSSPNWFNSLPLAIAQPSYRIGV